MPPSLRRLLCGCDLMRHKAPTDTCEATYRAAVRRLCKDYVAAYVRDAAKSPLVSIPKRSPCRPCCSVSRPQSASSSVAPGQRAQYHDLPSAQYGIHTIVYALPPLTSPLPLETIRATYKHPGHHRRARIWPQQRPNIRPFSLTPTSIS